ncbi:MAG: hypothetical protein JXA73_05790 [Acidobacteria bacterium]|nr:hypothetical protein [Acidobacteriota bacterium]
MINADRLVNHFNLTQLPLVRAVSEAGLLQRRSFSEAMVRLSLALAAQTPALFTAEPGLGKLIGRSSVFFAYCCPQHQFKKSTNVA